VSLFWVLVITCIRLRSFASSGFSKLPEPNITITYRASVILQDQRTLRGDPFEGGGGCRSAIDWDMVLDQHAIVQNRERAGLRAALGAGFRRVENDVIYLPLSWPPARIDERGGVAIEGGGLAIRISFILEAIQHLNLITAQKINTAIAAALAFPLRFGGRRPFDMQLHVTEFVARKNVPRVRHLHISILDFPRRGVRLRIPPTGK